MKSKLVLAPLGIALLLALPLAAFGQDAACPCQVKEKKKETKEKEPAGRADVLRNLPKKYAAFETHDPKAATVTLHIEGEKSATTWKIRPNAEIKFHGWWGRPDQFQKGDRVWVWFAIDRSRKANGILMLADEISEQHIHDQPLTIVEFDKKKGAVVVKDGKDKERRFALPEGIARSELKTGGDVYVQSAGDQVQHILTAKEFEQLRNKQKAYLRERWRKDGLPGMVSFLHPLGGEMEVMLDHQSMRWGRYLKNGDKVTLKADNSSEKPIRATVRRVEPFRETTRLLLVTNSGIDQLNLQPGQRIHAIVPEPPKEVQASELPTDLGRPRSREERLDWFLSTIYCTCSIAGDRCTGMFYTLASCNMHGCGSPRMMRTQIGKMIDEGLTDQQIFDRLLESRGPQLLLPHLLQ